MARLGPGVACVGSSGGRPSDGVWGVTAVGDSVDSDWDRQAQEQGIAEDYRHECTFCYGQKRVRRQETYRPNSEDGEV